MEDRGDRSGCYQIDLPISAQEEDKVMRTDYPINSEELTRRILGHQNEPKYGRFLQGRVRPLLRKFKCPKGGSARQARWLIDAAMERRVRSAVSTAN